MTTTMTTIIITIKSTIKGQFSPWSQQWWQSKQQETNVTMCIMMLVPVVIVRAIVPHTEGESLCIQLLIESQSPGNSCNWRSLGIIVKMGIGVNMGIGAKMGIGPQWEKGPRWESSPAELVQVNTSWTSEDLRLMFTKCHWLFPPLESSYLEVYFLIICNW